LGQTLSSAPPRLTQEALGDLSDYAQGGAANPETTNHWFKLLNQTIIKYYIVPELTFAMDERIASSTSLQDISK